MRSAVDIAALMAGALRSSGVRLTRQRAALLNVLLAAQDHPGAEELHRRARREGVRVSLATVYRTLAVLEREGLVQRHAFEQGSARYEMANSSHHDHIVDLDSGEIIEFRDDRIEDLQREIATRMGYEIVHHRLELYCRKR